MPRLGSAILIIVLLGLIVQSLDARQISSRTSSARRSAGQRRFKRDFEGSLIPADAPPLADATPCDEDDASACDQSIDSASAISTLFRGIQDTNSKSDVCVNGLSDKESLMDANMCTKVDCLLSDHGFAAFAHGHLTPVQLDAAGLMPLRGIDLSMLIRAQYVIKISGHYLLTALGIQALLIKHISISQLRTLSLLSFSRKTLTYQILRDGEFITPSCSPTALGLSSIAAHYFSRETLHPSDCPTIDESSESLQQHISNGYVHSESGMLMTVAFSAIEHNYMSLHKLTEHGLFPFLLANVSQATGAIKTNQKEYNLHIIKHMVQLGYLQARFYYLTYAAYHAIKIGYFTIQHFSALSLWPCQTPSLQHFILGGYTTQSGQMTALGHFLLHLGYLSQSMLNMIGVLKPSSVHLLLHSMQYHVAASSQYLDSLTHSSSPDDQIAAVPQSHFSALPSAVGGSSEDEAEQADSPTLAETPEQYRK